MKVTWRDFATTALAVTGGAIVWAKFYDYSWVLLQSWRSSVAILLGLGVVMLAVGGFEFSISKLAGIGESAFILLAGVLGVIGLINASETTFYLLAGALGALWLVNIISHTVNYFASDDGTTHTAITAH